jgi:hypothetical protein
MCDTLYRKTADGFIFGKNSDRSPNEPNLTLFYPARDNKSGMLKCTYVSIDESSHVNALLLIQPSWMWGGEMGINDKGVMIGNEAVFTRSKGKKENRLLGMDLLRLALERGDTAQQCMDIVISLTGKYGQGGNCGFDKSFYYDNSYLIADGKKAFVLETSGRDCITHEIGDHFNISNRLCLNDGFSKDGQTCEDFAKRNSDFLFTHFSGSKIRREEAGAVLTKEDFKLEQMMDALCHHHTKDRKQLYSKGDVRSVCMHKSLLGDHTTSSMIVCSQNSLSTIWLTGCSTPCLAVYKPVWFSEQVPPVFTDKEESLKYWLKREWLVRAIYGGFVDETDYLKKRDALQSRFIDGELKLRRRNPQPDELHAFSMQCSQEEQAMVYSYENVINDIQNHVDDLPGRWTKCSKSLGRNVFETDLRKRLCRK